MELLTEDLLADRAFGFLRRLDLNLSAPDALYIAICRRVVGATPATLGEKMAAAARMLGLDLAVA